MSNRLTRWIATCGPVGHFKIGPGSFGSLIGIIFVLPFGTQSAIFAALWIALFCVAVWSSGVIASELGQKDPQSVVIDEVLGMMTSFWLIPINWKTVLIGFVGFRFFDIVKPPPIRSLERLPKGWGIVLDDVAAGFCTNVVLQLLVRYAHL